MTPMLSRSNIAAVLVLLIGGGFVYWHERDPAPAIAAELRATVQDANNHAAYAELLRHESAMRGHFATATFATPCFWSGEGRFGLMDGVYATTPGYLHGREVVRVEYDPSVVTYEDLQSQADPHDALRDSHEAVCRFNADASKASRADSAFHPDDQPKWYLQQSDLRFIPMTPAQATRVNAYLHADRPIDDFLSPTQRALLQRIKASPNASWVNALDHPLVVPS